MHLTRHKTPGGARWAADGKWLTEGVSLGAILQQSRSAIPAFIQANVGDEAASGEAPGAARCRSGSLGQRRHLPAQSRGARGGVVGQGRLLPACTKRRGRSCSSRPPGGAWSGRRQPIRVRDDSAWNVPEPELTLVINAAGEIVGYTAGNDVSSRDIEGENPLYLPQAKVYNGSCALGPGITIEAPDRLRDLPIRVTIARDGAVVFDGSIRTSQIKRPLEELAGYLYRELAFPEGRVPDDRNRRSCLRTSSR